MEPQTGAVVVGVDGTTANQGAVRWAVAEARRRGAPLTLVHVVPDYVPISPLLALTAGDLTEVGTAVLSGVEERVRRMAPDLEVDAALHHGGRAAELAAAARDASVLVLGRDERSILHRLLEGDTATRTAARAAVPVVDVPAHWMPAEHADGGAGEHGVVLVGVKSPGHADELLGAALDAARAQRARLVVLHAWHLPSAYDDIIEGRVAREQVEREGTVELEGLLQPWRATCPEIEIETRVVHDRPGTWAARPARCCGSRPAPSWWSRRAGTPRCHPSGWRPGESC